MRHTMSKNHSMRTMYEQHWTSQRQGVIERLTITSIFSAMFGGFLWSIKDELSNPAPEILAIIIFLMLFSIWSILFTLKVDCVLSARENAARRIVADGFHLSDFDAECKEHWVTKVRIGRLFPIFFSMCFCSLLFILLKVLYVSFHLDTLLRGYTFL